MSELQKERVLRHLLNGNKITPIDALNMFGCFRLAAIIHDLKSEGQFIQVKIVSDKKTGKNFAQYWMDKVTDGKGQQQLL